jgi:hypothetical protein
MAADVPGAAGHENCHDEEVSVIADKFHNSRMSPSLMSHDKRVSPHPYDRLTPDVIIAAVESLGYVSDRRILALNSYENRVYQVGVERGAPLVVKFYRPQRWSTAAIVEEHGFALELAAAEIPVVPPQVQDGRTLFEYDRFSSRCSSGAADAGRNSARAPSANGWAAFSAAFT